MPHLRSCLVAALLFSPALRAQSPPAAAPTLQVNTQVVLVDVVVTDKIGKPVQGLTRNDFILKENGRPQSLKSFTEHSGSADSGVQFAPATPGIFANEPVSASSGAVDVLLVDTLNTPATAQPYLRDQLVKFIASERPGSHVAIFAMTSQLHMLQDFTSDASLLRRAIRAQGVKFSPLLQRDLNDTSSHQEVETLESVLEASKDPGQRAMLEGLQGTLLDMQARQTSAQTQVRARETMQMLRQIGRYLAGVPGRKNLLWFSGAFPVVVQRDPQSTGDPFAGFADMGREFRDTLDLLARSQVAVYAVDARGLEAPPSMDAANDNSIADRQRSQNIYGTTAPNPQDAQFRLDRTAEHSTMREIAEATGGRAFYNTNGLAEATSQAVRDGSQYYTLTYALPEPDQKGYRRIDVQMSKVKGVELAFRRGYSVDAGALAKPSEAPSGTAFADAVPASAPTATELTFAPGPDGKTHVALDFAAVLYDREGKLLDSHQDRAMVALDPDRTRAIQASSLRVHSTVTLPANEDIAVRLLVRDVPTGRLGTLQISAAAIRAAAVPTP